MVIFVFEKVKASFRGELSRWMIELKTGVMIGTMSALVRDKLWEKCKKSMNKNGSAIQIWTTNNEQGYTMRSYGELSQEIRDFDGLLLIGRKKKTRK